jgi:hypothetical protein
MVFSKLTKIFVFVSTGTVDEQTHTQYRAGNKATTTIKACLIPQLRTVLKHEMLKQESASARFALTVHSTGRR